LTKWDNNNLYAYCIIHKKRKEKIILLIKSQITLFRTDPTELELKLTGLICNCEQQLCCDQQLFIYKKLLAHPPFENLDLDSHLGAERAKQFRRFECNYPGHELCPDWEEVDYKDVSVKTYFD
jgi:hypothetical protein